jgi:GNAT superfamily N-acetyltransferase
MTYNFLKFASGGSLTSLKADWRATLTAPQDGMWESFADMAAAFEISNGAQVLGYAVVNDENQLLNFFLHPQFMSHGVDILSQFLKAHKIGQAVLGTNNPVAMTMALQLQQKVIPHTYLFHDAFDGIAAKTEGTFGAAEVGELNDLIEFYHYAIGAPKDWLQNYLGDLLAKGEVYALKNGEHYLGACEVRSSQTNDRVADVGMVVSPDHRRKGLGTYLLGQAKRIAKENKKQAICSCEVDNLGSKKSIEKNGFVSMHQMLLLDF